jgi:hypothetical protein
MNKHQNIQKILDLQREIRDPQHLYYEGNHADWGCHCRAKTKSYDEYLCKRHKDIERLKKD